MFAKSRTEALPNIGKKWTDLEEQQLLNELEICMEYREIAINHGRTEGGITAHINDMVYRLYLEQKPKEEIMKLLHVSDKDFDYTISCKTAKRENRQKRKESHVEQKVEPQPVLMIAPPLQSEFTLVKTELADMKTKMNTIKTEVLAIKKMLKHISTLMESIYKFESA
jgi:hypothetical protein